MKSDSEKYLWLGGGLLAGGLLVAWVAKRAAAEASVQAQLDALRAQINSPPSVASPSTAGPPPAAPPSDTSQPLVPSTPATPSFQGIVQTPSAELDGNADLWAAVGAVLVDAGYLHIPLDQLASTPLDKLRATLQVAQTSFELTPTGSLDSATLCGLASKASPAVVAAVKSGERAPLSWTRVIQACGAAQMRTP